MPAFRIRDLIINIAAASVQGSEAIVAPEAGCDGSTIACFNGASIHPPERLVVREAACDEQTIACFNSASIHPGRVLELIAAFNCDGATVACFNAASVHPPEVIRAAVPISAATNDLAALKKELRDALARLDASEPSNSAPSAPQTLAEVEMLQRQLSDALEHLDIQHKTLRKDAVS